MNQNYFSYGERLHEFDSPTIRVLDILPGHELSLPIHCRLRCVRLGEKPDYDAISYCWGESASALKIICNSGSLNITQNLHDALSAFRSQSHIVSVWADAICINQNDNDEKSQQIPLMWQIYQDTRIVRVWLGKDEAGNAPKAFELLRSFYARAEKLAKDIGIPFSELLAMSQNYLLKEGINSTEFHSFEPDKAWDLLVPSFGEFVKLKWWARVWVVQEILFGSADAILYWGDAQISWNTAMLAIRAATRLVPMIEPLSTGLPPDTANRIHRPMVMFKASQSHTSDESSRPTLLALLLTFRQWTSGDARDRVFALLNLSRTPNLIRPDYRSDYTVEDVYFDTAAAILAIEPDLVLLAVSGSLENPPNPNLPSWVPVWGEPFGGHVVAINIMGISDNISQGQHFDATLVSTYHKGNYKISKDRRVLTLRGIIMDEIAEIISGSTVSDWHDRGQKSEEFTHLMDHIDLYRWAKVSRASRWKRYINGEPSFVALAKTLSYGKLPVDLPNESIQTNLDWRVERGWLPSVLYSWRVPWSSFLYQFAEWLWYWVSILFSRSVTKHVSRKDIYAIDRSIGEHSASRHFFRTRGGYIGQTTNLEIKAGQDFIALIQGCRYPLVLRPATGDGTRWRNGGGCYVHEMMYGERFDKTKCVKIELV